MLGSLDPSCESYIVLDCSGKHNDTGSIVGSSADFQRMLEFAACWQPGCGVRTVGIEEYMQPTLYIALHV